MAKIEIKSQGGSKTYEVDDELVTIGRDEKNHIRIKDQNAAPYEAKLTRSGGQWRIEAAEAGRKISLNGLAVTSGDLEPGDSAKVGTIEIVFHGDAAPIAEPAPKPEPQPQPQPQRTQPTPKPVLRSGQKPAAEPTQPVVRSRTSGGPAPRAGTGRSGAGTRGRGAEPEPEARDRRGGHRNEPRRSASNSVGLYSIIGLVAIAGVYLVFVLIGNFLAGTPAQALETARGFLRDGNPEDAEKVLKVLEDKGPDAQMRADIDRMRKQIVVHKNKAALGPQVAQASSEQGAVLSFWSMHLQKEPYKRPEARQGISLANVWLEKYRSLADVDPDFADSAYKEIKERVKKADQYAHMGEPDTAEDALYRADYLTRLSFKRWRDAIKALDEYLARDPKNEKVIAMRNTRLNQAKNFLEDKLHSADSVIAKTQDPQHEEKIKSFIEQFEFQLKSGGLVEWAPQLQAKLAQLNAALPKR